MKPWTRDVRRGVGGAAVSGTATIVHGNALALDIPDSTVDLICTSPPYFSLRSYQDNGAHYEGQIGAEATPAEFIDALIAATREMIRVLKPSGSIWVNLGDKYSQRTAMRRSSHQDGLQPDRPDLVKDWKASRAAGEARMPRENITDLATGNWAPEKSLIGIPWRYALRCIDELGLILRAEVIWSKVNGLPESVTDRVRRSHETWFHLTVNPRYYSAVDEIREEHVYPNDQRYLRSSGYDPKMSGNPNSPLNPLGKLPGSVWTIPTQPLIVPEHIGIDHFAAFPFEFPRRIIRGWSPAGVCVECGQGRRPVASAERAPWGGQRNKDYGAGNHGNRATTLRSTPTVTITGYACACPDDSAPTTPGVVLDPFMGTGTTLLMAKVLGRDSIGVDLSADYCRLAEWRINDPGQIASAMQVEKPEPVSPDQMDLFGEIA